MYIILVTAAAIIAGYILEALMYIFIRKEPDIPEEEKKGIPRDIVKYFYKNSFRKSVREASPVKYPVIQVLTVTTCISLYLKYGISPQFFAACYIISLLLIMIFIDIKYRIIPQGILVSGFIGGIIVLILNLFISFEIYESRTWWVPLIGMISSSGILFIISLVGYLILKTDDAMGMGDVKIFIPIGLFLGWKMALVSLTLTIMLGGIGALITVIISFKNRKKTIAYGPFIAIATYITLLYGPDLLKLYFSHFAGRGF